MFSSNSKLSGFDAMILLNSPLTPSLEDHFLRAMEAHQRVNSKAVSRDKSIIWNFQRSTNDADHSLDLILEGLKQVDQFIGEFSKILDRRIKFHKEKGLDKVLYIMEHDFVRGWKIIEERTLPYLTFGFYEIRARYRRVVDQLRTSLNDTGNERLLAIAGWQQMEHVLLERLDILQRASDNITEVDESYKSGKPLLTYTASLDRRYDMTWITVQLLQSVVDKGNYDQDKFYTKIVSTIFLINKTISTYLAMGNTLIETGETDTNLWDDTDWSFRKACVNYNYYVFLYKERIVQGPVIVIQEKIREFDLLNRTLNAAKDSLLSTMTTLRLNILTLRKTSWLKIRIMLKDAMFYMNNKERKKAELAKEMKSKRAIEAMEDVRQFFPLIRTSGLTIQEKLNSFQDIVKNVWMNMLNEYTTRSFYEKVYEDFLAYQNDSNFFVPYFADLLNMDEEVVAKMTASKLKYLLNADFSSINVNETLEAFEKDFSDLKYRTNVAVIIGGKDESLFLALETYKTSLETFITETKITTAFYQ